MQERLDEILREAIARAGGPRDPFGPRWDMKATFRAKPNEGGSDSVYVTRLSHATEGINPFKRYELDGLALRDGSWEPAEWLAKALGEMVVDAHRLEMRDEAVRLYGRSRDDHDDVGDPVLSGRTHAHAPPPWAYSTDRMIRLVGGGIGWSPREMSVPIGSAFKNDGSPSSISVNGLKLMTLMRTGLLAVSYAGRVHGSRIDAEIVIGDGLKPRVTLAAHDGGRVISITDTGDLPETMIQGIVGRDIGEVLSLPGVSASTGVRITGATRTGRTLHLTHPCVLDPLDQPPASIGNAWLELGAQ